MNQDRENLNERYLDAALRDALGPQVDLTQRVLRAAGEGSSRRHRVMPLPRRTPAWQPLAAAAAVLIVAGLGVFALVQFLPQDAPGQSMATKGANEAAPRPQPANQQPAPESGPEQPTPTQPDHEPEEPALPDPQPEPAPKVPDTVKIPAPDEPEPEPKLPEAEVKEEPHRPYPEGWTDPPESWPGRLPAKPDGTDVRPRAVVSADIKPSRKDGVRIAENGKWKVLPAGRSLYEGDRVKVSGWADFTLTGGALVRLDGEMALTLEGKAAALQLFDGAMFVDCTAPLAVHCDNLVATVSGQAVLERRVRSMDVAVLLGTVGAGQATLSAGRMARLESEGFTREKAVSFADLQREHRFLKDAPERKTLREDFTSYKGEIWGGEVKDGVLKGGHDKVRGLAFHFEPLSLRGNEVVRVRYKVSRRVEVVFQFGTTGDGNFRHVVMNPEPGKWHEAEIPIREFSAQGDGKTRLGAGLSVRRFQVHDNDGAELESEIAWFEIISRP